MIVPETFIQMTDQGFKVCFTIDNQTFCLKELTEDMVKEEEGGENMSLIDYARWWRNNLDTAFDKLTKESNHK